MPVQSTIIFDAKLPLWERLFCSLRYRERFKFGQLPVCPKIRSILKNRRTLVAISMVFDLIHELTA
jgi:hypothetical protein